MYGCKYTFHKINEVLCTLVYDIIEFVYLHMLVVLGYRKCLCGLGPGFCYELELSSKILSMTSSRVKTRDSYGANLHGAKLPQNVY
jgi:hypothetical protein